MENKKDRETRPQPEGEPQAVDGRDAVSSGSAARSDTTVRDPQELMSSYDKLLQEKQDIYDRLLRKQAELDNFRKRMQREKEDFLQHATTDLVRALLPTLDGFERALKQRDPAVPEQFYKGMELIYKQLADVLGRAGLVPVEAAGRTFDPNLHQAVETVESAGHRDNEVVEELQKGYKLKERQLRPAIVKVSVEGDDSGGQRSSASGARSAEGTEAGED
jgi:molecular chaperone GrpE